MLNVRGSSFNENGIGEPEQDANSALTELDKGVHINHKFVVLLSKLISFVNVNRFAVRQNRRAVWSNRTFSSTLWKVPVSHTHKCLVSQTGGRFSHGVQFYLIAWCLCGNFYWNRLFCRSNFLRLCVLRVCQQSEKHLDKISNVDEFVRRVFSVTYSNDPIARALTLRTLGAVAGIIPERQQVHHSIRRSLDSHDYVEVEAAIFAAIQFAAQSK